MPRISIRHPRAAVASLLASIFWLLPVLSIAAVYHVDARDGDDQQTGTTPATAWKTLRRVNAQVLQPGDRVLLRAGRTFGGVLHPQGTGEAGRPIRVDRYGEGGAPVIDAGGVEDDGGFFDKDGKSGSAVYLRNQAYWEIANLEITNHGKAAGYRRGVRVEANAMGVCRHIQLRNLVVRDVNGLNKSKGNAHHELSKQSGGIFLLVTGDDRDTRFADVLVEGCVVKHCDRSGISVGARAHWYPQWNKLLDPAELHLLHENIVIRNNAVEDLGGDGIVVQYAKSPVIEYNVCKDAAARSHKQGQYSAGIWPWMCEDALFQYNEASFTRSTLDGQGFDCDSGRGTIYQYNYSHDNEGGFMLFCQGSSRDSIVRYNISRNDRFALFTNSGGTALVHNNVFHIGPGHDTDVNFKGAAGKMRIFNNIFVNEGKCTTPRWGPYQYEANYYHGYQTMPDDPRKVVGALRLPATVAARAVVPLQDVAAWRAGLGDFRLGLPLLRDAGIAAPTGAMPATKDLWGNALRDGKPDLGVFEAGASR